MFKHTKRLLSDIRFWCQEIKLRSKENAEWERIEDEAEGEWRHPMAGFAIIPRSNATALPVKSNIFKNVLP